MPQIVVHNLKKSFTTYLRNPEKSFLNNLFRPEIKHIAAVDGIDFSIERGERVAFIGPNGAGKSTTIKMLVGILQPTSGGVVVAGCDPTRQRRQLAEKVGTLFGQRSQLMSNLPLLDGFELFGALYGLPSTTVRRRSKELIERFALADFATQPVRKLSLGQRMRAEVAVSLLHKPEVLLLDEPTIGLDVVAKRTLRETLLDYNKREGVTILLTSHDPTDVEALCTRTIVINHGRLVLDEPTDDLRSRYFTTKHIHYVLKNGDAFDKTVDVREHDLRSVLKTLLDEHDIEDLDVSDPSMEEVIEAVYARAQ